ncbi:hypothetical protein GDO81_025840 [Engystomops pustulosus]|uniref:Protein tyrosine phosphatase receptor type C-associated protein n=1 Tax=Engystomops pustulosus TaxID=76066 RepID=A0AAV6YRR0_ENGPU|nr:hypothetical protein GDO81_025840 [Engystomops pustulosus]
MVGAWLSLLPVIQAEASHQDSAGTMTVVLLLFLLILLCVALIVAWKRLINTEGGEDYHPQELWGRARDVMQNIKSRWSHGGRDEEVNTVEDNQDGEDEEEEEEAMYEEHDITAL